MKWRRIAALVERNLKKLARDRGTLFLLILFPVVMTFVFGLAFGGIGGSGNQSFAIGVVNLDDVSGNDEWATDFIGNLSDVEGIDVVPYQDITTGHDDLLSGSLDGLIIIPLGFGDSCYSYWLAPQNESVWLNSTIDLYVDSGSIIATSAIPPIVQQTLLNTLFGNTQASFEIPIKITSPELVVVSSFTQWEYMVPGMFAFSAIFITVIVAQSMTVERSDGILKRFSTTPLSSAEYMVSQLVSYLAVASLQVAMIFITSFLIGYRPATGVLGIGFAVALLGVFSLVCVGLGLIAATFSKSEDSATGLAFMIALPQMFLGTFMPLGGIAEAVSAFMPSKYVTDALTTLFLRGAQITTFSIWMDLGMVVIASAIVVIAGILLFEKWGRG
ncbi:MAG: ABC transporter permease [Candidatus Thorarchaeota archaeon]